MKVGDYVRLDYHRVSTPIQIAKITETRYDSEDDSICYSTDVGLVIEENNLVKEPSLNIIDLIEVGDYVNGYKIISIGINDNQRNVELYVANQGYDELVLEQDIKSIVTKEQFEQMEYKIGDENE